MLSTGPGEWTVCLQGSQAVVPWRLAVLHAAGGLAALPPWSPGDFCGFHFKKSTCAPSSCQTEFMELSYGESNPNTTIHMFFDSFSVFGNPKMQCKQNSCRFQFLGTKHIAEEPDAEPEPYWALQCGPNPIIPHGPSAPPPISPGSNKMYSPKQGDIPLFWHVHTCLCDRCLFNV